MSLVVQKNGRRETGSSGCGGRGLYEEWINKDRWKGQVKALRIANTNLESIPTPAEEMPVILGPGWPRGVMSTELLDMVLKETLIEKVLLFFKVKLVKK